MKKISFVLLCFWISACSLAEVAYNNLDWYVVWQVNKFIDLDAGQERFVTKAAEDYLSWHRSEEMPQYREILIRIRHMAADSLTTVGVDSIFVIFKERILRLMESASDETGELLLSLTPAQIDEMEKRMEKINRRYETEDGDDEEPMKLKRAKRIRNRAEDWVGRLTTGQTEWMMQYAMQMPTSTSYWLGHRRWRQKQLLSILRGNRTAEEKKLAIHLWVTRPEDGRSDEYIKVDKNVREALTRFIVEIDRRLEPFQRKRLQENLTKYIRITEELARK